MYYTRWCDPLLAFIVSTYDIKTEFIRNGDEMGNNPLPDQNAVLAPEDESKPVAQLPQSLFLVCLTAENSYKRP